ncbi:MAG: stage V sporulation protein AB [Lachnospiraceae bacterium]|nr:stage V sporulation protein AB [Lachnospiraceae bacterium]
MLKLMMLGFGGFTFGLLTSAGVFTVLSAVGLIPRFVGTTHSAKEIWLYEDMVIGGTIVGGMFSIFEDRLNLGAWMLGRISESVWIVLGNIMLGVIGVFGGMFVGCLALAIAEMLDSIPILTRRISFRHGLGLMVLSIALGKLFGSLYFFIKDLAV